MKDVILKTEYPLYSRRIMDYSRTYVKQGKILKYREVSNIFQLDIKKEVENHNNIVIEDSCRHINIFCNEEKKVVYQKLISDLQKTYGDEINKLITIHSKFNGGNIDEHRRI